MESSRTLPVGVNVTFMFTDIEGSTSLLRRVGHERYRSILEDHAVRVREVIAANGGVDVSTEGDAFFVVFPEPSRAVTAAAEIQQRLTTKTGGDEAPVRVRMGLHTGHGALGGDNYVGLDVHKAARIASAGHGGQVLISDKLWSLTHETLPDGVKMKTLGEYRLKDFPEPERIFQLEIAGLATEFPPLRAIGRNNLPTRLTPLVGRSKEIDAIRGLLEDNRLVTLTGAGGSGKTRLAIEVAERSKYEFLDGAFFVSLGPISDPELVAPTIADVLDIAVDPAAEAIVAVNSYLEGKETLLVLDNFEQILDAAIKVGELLAAAPRLKVVITSREALHLSVEQEFPVPPLELPGPSATDPEVVSQYEAVALFIQRARAARPNFEVNVQNAPAIAEITTRLDGLPLAIELAAARITLMSPEGILTRLSSALSLLKTKAADLPARHQTLRNTIKWSYELLDADEQALFRRLSVFVRGFALESAEEVAGPGLDLDILDGISSLIDKNLVLRYEAKHGEERYHMLVTIRDYALEELNASGEADGVHRRHAGFCLKLVEEAQPHLLGDKQEVWIDRLDHEHDNIRAALDWATTNDIDLGMRMGGALWRFWHLRGHLMEGRDRMEGLLQAPGAETPTAARAAALDGLAGVVYWRADYGRAADLYKQSIEIYRNEGNRAKVAETLMSISSSFHMGGDSEGALPYARKGLVVAREIGDPVMIKMAAGEVGGMLAFTGHFDEALPLLEEYIDGVREAGNKLYEAVGIQMVGWVAFRRGHLEEARARFLDALDLVEKLGDRTAVAIMLNRLADLAIEQQDLPRALRLAGAAEAIRQEYKGGVSPTTMHARDPREFAAEVLSSDTIAEEWGKGVAMSYEDALEDARQPLLQSGADQRRKGSQKAGDQPPPEGPFHRPNRVTGPP